MQNKPTADELLVTKEDRILLLFPDGVETVLSIDELLAATGIKNLKSLRFHLSRIRVKELADIKIREPYVVRAQ